ncbi:MAG: hypothetical protein Q9217_004474 [Psora testacea]
MPSFWDSYICTEPAGDVSFLIRNGPDEYTASLRTLQRSADHFSEKDQTRIVERIQFEQARLHMQHQQWKHAMRILVPLWQTLSWRKSGWWHLLEEVDRALQECAGRVEDAESLVAVQWELLNRFLTPRQEEHTNSADGLRNLAPLRSRPKIKLRAENILSCVSVGFTFNVVQGNVGVPLEFQLVISSHAQPTSEPLTIKRAKIAFEGGLKDIDIEHATGVIPKSTDKSEHTRLQQVNLGKAATDNHSAATSPISSSSGDSLSGLADMTLAAGSTIILAFTDVPRNAGEEEVSSITLIIQEEDFDLEFLVTEHEHMQQDYVFVKGSRKWVSRRASDRRSIAIRILPKPPKLRLEVAGLESEIYTNETITLVINGTNEEEDEADIALDVQLLGPSENVPLISWQSEDGNCNPLDRASSGTEIGASRLLNALPPFGKQQRRLLLRSPPQPAEYVLEIRARYYLKSDPETPIVKSTTAGLVFRQPFEALSSFSPVIHPDPWPDYFEIGHNDDEMDSGIGEDQIARGLVQRWLLISRIRSLASAPLIIERVEPRAIQVQDAARSTISAVDANFTKPYTLPPGDLQERHFSVDVQKLDLEDRRSTFFDLQCEVSWRREGSNGPVTVTPLPVPELAVSFGEPRVLASACNGSSPPGVIHLDYVIENPSVYTLTFSLTMETSEEFAFSGVKSVTVRLVPLSRYSTRYSLLPLVKGSWISPQLRVYDTQFHKTLRVHSTEGMRSDRKGVSVWVDEDG